MTHRTWPRRDLLRLLALPAAASLGGALQACAQARRNFRVDRLDVARGTRRFVPVDVSAERHIRSTVGLRPYRNSGYRLESERLDGKQLIHNYGHGGGGMTLSWGTADQAVRRIEGNAPPGPVAVIGAGVIGLTTTVLLQRLGYDVNIYAAAAWPHTTSNASAATFYPSHVVAADRVTPAFTASFEPALRRSYHAYQRIVGSRYGVKWLDSFTVSRGGASGGGTVDIETQVHVRVVGEKSHPLPEHSHPFGSAHVRQGLDLVIEPMIYLRALLDDVRQGGARLHIRRFESLRELAQLEERTIFNCTGLGARNLLGDTQVRPARGQLVVLPPQPEVDYTLYHGPFYYMVPREDGIILGGTFDLDDSRALPDEKMDAQILGAHKEVFDAMG